MLSNTLTLDEEESVQTELRQMQEEEQVSTLLYLYRRMMTQRHRPRRNRRLSYHMFRMKNQL